MKRDDLTGRRFGRLTVVAEVSQRTKDGAVRWLCQCDCGTTWSVLANHLRGGNTTSCGCFRRDVRTTHGMRRTRLYNTWQHMIARCTNPKNNRYSTYGARGIGVFTDWLVFERFRDWALTSGYTDTLTIERIDCNKGYTPSNCTWVEPSKQSANRRCVIRLTDGVEVKTLDGWAARYGWTRAAVRNRFYKNHPSMAHLKKVESK